MPRRPQDRDLLAAVGARIKALRLRSGLSQEQLAAMANLAPHSISRFETGDLAPTLTTLAAIATALKVTVADLIDIDAPLPVPRPAGNIEELSRLYQQLGPDDRELLVGLARLAHARQRRG